MSQEKPEFIFLCLKILNTFHHSIIFLENVLDVSEKREKQHKKLLKSLYHL